jgi:hypothetical protein
MRKEGMEEDRADDCVRIEFGRVARKGGQPPTALQSPARECARDGIQFFLMKSPAYGSFYLKALLSFRRRCPHGQDRLQGRASQGREMNEFPMAGFGKEVACMTCRACAR